MRLRVELRDGQARVFLGDRERPVLEVHDLVHGVSRGALGIDGPRDGSACFASLSYTATDELAFDAPPPPLHRPGMIRDWQLSQILPVTEIDADLHPADQELPDLEWRAATLLDLFGQLRKDPPGRLRFRTGNSGPVNSGRVIAAAALHNRDSAADGLAYHL